MLLVAVLTAETADALRQVMTVHTVAHVSMRSRDGQILTADLAQASQVTADALILDVDAGPSEVLLSALRHYRTARSAVRIILLAAGREPGDPLISHLVGLGVYDILAPASAAQLPAALAAALAGPAATYAEAARWHHARPQSGSEQTKQAQPPREQWRVVTGGYRPFVIGVVGAASHVGTSDLAWHLALELARRGIWTALLADQPVAVLTAAIQHHVPATLPITIYGNDYPHSPQHQKLPAAAQAGTLLFSYQPQAVDRLKLAMDTEHGAQVAVVDFGPLLRAREREQGLLAAVDRLVMCWPQSPLHLITATHLIATQHHALVRILERTIHVAYLANEACTRLLTTTLNEWTEEPPTLISAPATPQGPDLGPLLDTLAPTEGQRRPWTSSPLLVPLIRAIRHWTTRTRRRHGSITRWALPRIGFLALAWLLLPFLTKLGIPLPDWIQTDLLPRTAKWLATWLKGGL